LYRHCAGYHRDPVLLALAVSAETDFGRVAGFSRVFRVDQIVSGGAGQRLRRNPIKGPDVIGTSPGIIFALSGEPRSAYYGAHKVAPVTYIDGYSVINLRYQVMPSCCICYTTDQAYLLPSLVSAVQARRYAATAKADVGIYCFGASREVERVFNYVCMAEGIKFFPIPMNAIEGENVMLARLFLTRFTPPEYDQLLYIDGDTQITGCLTPLLELQVPQGRFLAANDPMTFAISGRGKHDVTISGYLSSIGIPSGEATNYFNSGVLRINREGWEELGLGAWNLFQKLRENSRFPDQDALNIVGASRRIPMSLAWNFPIFMRNSRVENIIAPRIYHFMGSPKPWQGVFLPWGVTFYRPYVEVISKYPDLLNYLPVITLQTKIRYVIQQYYKKGLETVKWGLSDKRVRILNYEHNLSALAKL
jgi:lipopolysaccharide biosynthesis glycosyltransferase